MPVDLKISNIETRLNTTDPAQLQSPQFIARIVAQVKEEIKREGEEKERRDQDRMGIRGSMSRLK